MRFRGKSIRRKIVALLLVPLVSLTGLWGFATVLTGREARTLLDTGYIMDKIGYPIEDTSRVLQKERRESLVYLADPRAAEAMTRLRAEREATDRQIALIRRNAADPGVSGDMQPATAQRLTVLLDALDGLDSLRRSVDTRSVGRMQALDFYNRLVDPCYGFLMSLHALENVEMDKQGRALVGITRAREIVAREDALVASMLIAERITPEEIRALTDVVATRKAYYEANLEVLPSSERDRYERYWTGAETAPLRKSEEALIAAGATDGHPAVTAQRWQEQAAPVLDALAQENYAAGERLEERLQPAAYSVLLKAGIAGVLGFVALLVSIVVSVRIGRGLVRDLRRLRKEAQEVSGVRLPSVMRRLAAGEDVDTLTEVPRLTYGEDEVGQVGQALNTLQRAAVEAAVKQAELRRGVSEVFVNLARRNQVLLHRQLTLLDTMERRTEDTDELADLFRLDHLTTRMRRHAEGLVILSGAAPSRQWRKPVQLMDVVRAAVAEVEDYERIEVRRLPRLGVGGPAVADLTHLVAELLENATVFSPPHTAVQVLGERVANGFTLEIHDRGLGMNPEALLEANLRLAETPEFELSDTDRLGLFVVSRLAQRQNVRVSLQTSPYGGTTAVVFIPATLLTEAPETQGAGFRLDRDGAARRTDGRDGRDGASAEGGDHARTAGPAGLPRRRPALAKVPDPAPEPAASPVLDGPVELEPPVDGDSLDELLGGAADLLDSDSERGGLFRAREHRRRGTDDPAGAAGRAGQDSADGVTRLPRRRTPTLVVDHGRRLDEPGRAHPGPAGPGTAGDDSEHTGADGHGRGRGQGRDQGHGHGPGDGDTMELARVRPAPTLVPVPRQEEEPSPFDGLPRRVRQASLAPQLRAHGTRDEDRTAAAAEADSFERDAEEVRSRMASMQRGWQRGRRQNAEAADSGTADPGCPSTDSGTTGIRAVRPGTAGPGTAGRGAAEPGTAGPGTTAPGTTPEGDGR
ncbi:nitrate- and nitrite sensing domain-containing protein [Streptomyces sp. NPDC048717]|uniref:sensor histidine kinase n=1 Tax=Streptomyces sp. NPDC048717 TaxID=3154928 RepID=UPI0034269804